MRMVMMLFFFSFCIIGMAQQRKISGVVKDNTGEPLPGVNVVIKGTTQGTLTDYNGKFNLTVPSEKTILQFSFIGFQPQDIQVGTQETFNVTLREKSKELSEVVVTGYGGTQVKAKLTNSISTVKPSDLKIGVFSNPAQALSGAIPGLRVIQSSGNPGATPNIILRGGTNLDGSGSPLIFVDGELRSSLSDINPDDIASIDVLKDAGATAIYGARASNGVILVTTKHGQAGTSEVSLDVKVGLNYLNSPYRFMNGKDYLYWMRMGYKNASQVWQSSNGTWNGFTNMSTLSAATPYGTGNQYFASDGVTPLDGNVTSAAIWSPMLLNDQNKFLLQKGWKQMTDPIYGNQIIYQDFNWQKEAFNSPALTQDYSLGFSGGNDKGHYYNGLGYNYSQGLPINTYYKNLTDVFNGDYRIKPWLLSTTNINFAEAKWRDAAVTSEANYFGRMLSMPPTMRMYNANGDLIMGKGGGDENPRFNDPKFKRTNVTDKFTLGQSFKIDLMKDLYLKLSGTWMYDEAYYEAFNQDYLRAPGVWNTTRFTSSEFDRTLRQTYDAIANYDVKINDVHSISALLGFEFYDTYSYGNYASGSGAPTDDFAALQYTSALANMRNISSYHNEQRIMSFFGRINYDYMGKYLLALTGRQDGYSSFVNNRWGFFPGVSGGWVFTKEAFVKNVKDLTNILSFGKLRLSYGVNGNASGIGPYDLQGSYSAVTPYNGQVGFLVGGIPNPNLRWERSNTFETGLDFGLFDNITGSFTFYNRITTDKYATIPLPSTSGISGIMSNNGTLRNRGVEIELGYNILNKGDWKWNVNANISYNNNTILKLPDNGLPKNRQNAFQVYDPRTGNLIWVGGYQEGQSPDALYAYKALGIYKDQAQVEKLAGNLIDMSVGNNGSNNRILYGPDQWAQLTDAQKAKGLPIIPGDVIWEDVNHDGKIDQYDMVKVGNTTPRWIGGLNTTLSWKDFSLFVRTDYALGFVQYDNQTPWFMGDMQGTYNSIIATKDTWTPSNPNAKYPIYTWADQLGYRNYARQSSMFVYSGDYLAFREVSLSYALPKNILSKLGIQQIVLSITGQNLGYLTASKLYSPEATGSVGAGYSLPRTFILGANIKF
ncbi:SusC/RagA family TonB-linked outer membrane protein [Microbacter margulisiae]|uniref:SusC/RagA family TonB-linked outer membrane protein n=1 Tax=Microbacter margulisiae TaxID=1350067 RepID=UPI003CCD949E